MTAGPVQVRDRAVAKLKLRLAGVRDELRRILSLAANDPRVNAEGRACLNGLGHESTEHGEATPLGAAAVACAAAHPLQGVRMASFAELWIRDHGLVFAARAVAEFVGLTVDADVFRSVHSLRRQVDPLAHDTSTLYGVDGYSIARELRRHLAGAAAEDYRAVSDALAAYRGGSLVQRIVLSYLLPTQTEWVAQDCADITRTHPVIAELLVYAVSSVSHIDQLTEHITADRVLERGEMLPTLADGIGPDIATRIDRWLGSPHLSGDTTARAFGVLAALPTDDALDLLFDRLDNTYARPAVFEALRRFPVRALRLLAARTVATGKARSVNALTAAHLLRGHVLKRPELAAALPTLPGPARAHVEDIRTSAATEDAPVDALPPALVTPPWTVRRKAVKPVVVSGLVAPTDASVVWTPGEQESWSELPPWFSSWSNVDNQEWVTLAQDSQARVPSARVELLLHVPAETARPLLDNWRPADLYTEADLRPLAARFGTAALPALLRLARTNPNSCGGVLMPFASAEIATLMADWFARLKSARQLALAWFRRHPEAAAQGLIPTAVGIPGKQRRAAEAALLAIAAAGHDAEIRTAAQDYGTNVATAVDLLLDTDPLQILPARIPALPDWLDTAVLPRVLLTDGRGALPRATAEHLCTMLAMSKPDEAYAGIAVVKRVCTPESLAEFGWAVFQDWRIADTPAKDGWALTALGLVGDDETVRRLTPLIRTWPGEGGHARAVAGLDVLAAIGTDVALTHLHGIAQQAKSKGLRDKASQKITEIAAGLGLTTDQLADRLVPDLGLNPDGSLTLDYGSRQFTVGFDEQLKPYVVDQHGTRRKDLPKPSAHDDQDLAPAAHKRFATLKKNARTIVADQIRRLERAMIAQRRWTTAEFRALFVDHPLLWHLARRLVWASYDENGQLRQTFRVAEDRSAADADDNTVDIDPDHAIGLPHPVRLGGNLAAWSAVFSDYEIAQPFAQLGREVHRLTAEEQTATTLARFLGLTVPTAEVLGLERRGWVRGEPEHADVQTSIYLRTPGKCSVVVSLDPGISAGDPMGSPSQTIEHIWITSQPTIGWATPNSPSNLTFGALAPEIASEVLRDLTELTG